MRWNSLRFWSSLVCGQDHRRRPGEIPLDTYFCNDSAPYLCNGCGMPTEDAYSSGHLVLSHLGTCMCSNAETNLSWTCLVSGLLNFEHPWYFSFGLDRRSEYDVKNFPNVFRNNCKIWIPYDGRLRTSPRNQGKLTIGNQKSSRVSLTLVWILLPTTFISNIKRDFY